MNKQIGLIILLLLTSFMPQFAWAAPQPVSDDGFGRLFSSPAERKKLDILRQNQKLKVVTPQADAQQEAAVVELPEPITLQGYVKRSDGSTTLWVNNKPVQENSTVDEVEVGRLTKQKSAARNSLDGLNITIPANGKHVRLKAGQMYEPETNQIKELKLLEKEKQLSLEQTGIIGNEVSP